MLYCGQNFLIYRRSTSVSIDSCANIMNTLLNGIRCLCVVIRVMLFFDCPTYTILLSWSKKYTHGYDIFSTGTAWDAIYLSDRFIFMVDFPSSFSWHICQSIMRVGFEAFLVSRNHWLAWFIDMSPKESLWTSDGERLASLILARITSIIISTFRV